MGMEGGAMSLLKKMFSMRLSVTLMDALAEAAKKEGRTRTGLIEWVLACWLEDRNKKK